jgi:diguanylate cyclase (GGDEF)-like protein
MESRAFRGYLGLGGLAVAGYLALPTAGQDVLYLTLGLSGAVAIAVGIRIHRPVRSLPWWLMAVGLLTWMVGDVLYTWYDRFTDTPPFPSVADALYLSAYPLLAVGFALLVRGLWSGRDNDGLIDSAIFTVALGLLSWVFLMRPTVMDDSASLLERAVGLAYPLGDILLLGVLVRLATSRSARTPAFGLLAAAGTLMLLADTSFSVLALTSSYEGGAVDLLWLGSYVVWGAAALHPSMRSLSQPPPDVVVPLTRRRLAALTTAILMAPAVLAAQLVLGVALDGWAVVISSAALSILVVARMSGLLRRVQTQAGRLAEMARTDALTGLPNRRSADAELARLCARSRTEGLALSVAMIDVDRFKSFNDTYGHQAGDRLLVEAAASWRRELGVGDAPVGRVLARYGGEEFLALVLSVRADDAVRSLERVRAVTPAGQTVSVGLATWDGVEDATSLVHRADVALYVAKRSGRDRLVVADEPEASAVAAPVAVPAG